MQVYKTFLKIAVKSIGANILYLVVFLILALSLAKSSSGGSIMEFTASKVNVAVFDKDNTDLSHDLYNYIDSTQNLKVITSDEEKWPDELFYHTAELIVVIEKGYESNLINGKYNDLITTYDNPDTNQAFIVENQINTYVSNMRNYLQSGYDYKTAALKASEITNVTTNVSYLEPEIKDESTSTISYFYNYYPYIILCIMINSLSPMLLIWNRPGIKARTNISSLSTSKKYAGIIAATLTYAVIVYGIFIAVSFIFFKSDSATLRGVYYFINAFIYLIVCLSISFLVAQLCKKATMLSVFSNVIGLSTSFLCGVFVIRSLLPDKVILYSKCLPTYWYINVTEELKYSTSNTLSNLAVRSMIIQLLFAAAIYAISLVIIKLKRQNNN